jgi:hypothetical protein
MASFYFAFRVNRILMRLEAEFIRLSVSALIKPEKQIGTEGCLPDTAPHHPEETQIAL